MTSCWQTDFRTPYHIPRAKRVLFVHRIAYHLPLKPYQSALSGTSYQNEYYWLKLISLQQFLETGRRGLQISGTERVNTDYRVNISVTIHLVSCWEGETTQSFMAKTGLTGSHTLKVHSSTSEKALFGQATLFRQKHLPLQHKQHYSREECSCFQSEMTLFPEKAGRVRESSLFNQRTLL